MRSPTAATKPDAIESSYAGLIGIPGYETIREDLERVLARNECVERLEAIDETVDHMLNSVSASAKDPLKKDAWQNATLEALIAKYGIGYAAYRAHSKLQKPPTMPAARERRAGCRD